MKHYYLVHSVLTWSSHPPSLTGGILVWVRRPFWLCIMNTRCTPWRGIYNPGVKLLAVQYIHESKRVQEVQRIIRSSVHCWTIHCWKALYNGTYAVVRDPSTYEKLGWRSILTADKHKFILELLNDKPTLYLDEYRKVLYKETGNWVATSNIFRDLKIRLGISLKKTRTVHPNQDPVKRARFFHTVGGLRPDMLVFLGPFGVFFSCFACSHW